MTLPDLVQNRLSALEARLSTSQRKLDRLREAERFTEQDRVRDNEFIQIFKDVCAFVREAELANAPYLLELARAADKILDDGIGYSYGRDSGVSEIGEYVYDFMPSWAHDEAGGRPLINDESGIIALPPSGMDLFILGLPPRPGRCAATFRTSKTGPWNVTLKRHPKSSNLARFRSNIPVLTPALDKPLAASILDARCEVSSSSRTANPIGFVKSTGNTCLALLAMGGYKNHEPALEYLILDQPLAPAVNFPTLHCFDPGLARIAFHGAIDETRRLIFVGDDVRVKSYEWGSPSGETHEELFPVHTLNTKPSGGPMTVLPNGSLVRAGKGGASVFDLQTLPTHGPDGDKIIGKSINFRTMRDDPYDVERSSGSIPTSHIKFLDQPNLKPHLWQPLLTAPSTVVCVENAREAGKYSCIGIDLEAEKSTSYYLGHGAVVSDFSVSAGDPGLFLTACNDGLARLFDVRSPLPVVTFDACGHGEFCEAAALAHPNSVPIVFTGACKAEQIKVWDVRARACVYELATGNNGVQSLAWDAGNNCLYAATDCRYMDRLGYHHDYRYAKVPKDQPLPGFEEEGEEYDDCYADKDYYKDGDRCWPKPACHKENYFGYLYDAGDDLILRYAFKEDPNLSVVPQYGNARPGRGYW
ncbi:Myosin heavy chain kinase B [Rhizoctonia solani]|uniref:Myosin heavy chain kinase B n=1 Tax=Rhizoctonia solani TaxID=456999 RepID=A0A0K6G8P3_9AGAM|nr:Myosin heavy chain kinase B [Rhizoctonia solani]